MWSRPHTRQGLATASILLVVVACAVDRPEPLPPAQPTGFAACERLVAAAPGDWPAHWKKVHVLGKNAVPGLIRALRGNVDGPGAQAAVHLLGIGGSLLYLFTFSEPLDIYR